MEIDIIGLISACSYALDCIEAELVNIKNKHGKRVAYISVRMGQYFDLPEPIQWISRSCVSGSTLYFTMKARKMQEAETTESGVPSAHRFLRIKNTIFFPAHHAKPHLEK